MRPAIPSPLGRRRRGAGTLLLELDLRLLRAARTRGHAAPLEGAAKAVAGCGEWGAGWAVAGAFAAAVDSGRRARWLKVAAVAPGAVGLNFAVKLAVRRQRPVLRGLPPLASAPSSLSFPSAHATSSVAAAVAIGRVEPSLRLPALATAGLMCATRPYLGMHYPSDVLAGALLGALLGALVPGVGPRPTEERLIDLVAERAARNGDAADSRPSPLTA